MTAIQRTVDISESRQLVLDIPKEIPTGKTEMMIVFYPLPEKNLPNTQSHKNAIEKARGIAKRMGATLTVDTFLRWKHDVLTNEEKFLFEECQRDLVERPESFMSLAEYKKQRELVI